MVSHLVYAVCTMLAAAMAIGGAGCDAKPQLPSRSADVFSWITLVSDAVVVQEGNHFAIEVGAGDSAELEAIGLRLAGRCDCGAPLSRRGEHLLCRTCSREYRWQ